MLLLDKASFKSFLRDFMDSTMDNTKHILNYLMPIIDQVNPEVHDFMQRYANVPLEPPGYCSQGHFHPHIPSTTVASSGSQQLMVVPRGMWQSFLSRLKPVMPVWRGFRWCHLQPICLQSVLVGLGIWGQCCTNATTASCDHLCGWWDLAVVCC